MPSSGLPKRRLTLVYGLLLAVALVQVPLVAYLLSARGASPTAPLAPGGRLIARGPASNPRLIVTPNGLIGWWLTGNGAGQRLTVALFGRGRVARRRTIALSTLAGAGGVVQDTPALALGPGWAAAAHLAQRRRPRASRRAGDRHLERAVDRPAHAEAGLGGAAGHHRAGR